jgi:hypothetical protein
MEKFSVLYWCLLAFILSGCKRGAQDPAPDNRKILYTTLIDSLSEGRYAMKVLQTGHYTCFVGGGIRKTHGLLSSYQIDVYHDQSQKWSAFTIPEKRMAWAAAATNNHVWIG